MGGDITYVSTREGWLYLTIALDLIARKIVGYSMQSSPHQDLVIKALDMGSKRQFPGQDLISHSDRGSQYNADDYKKFLKDHNIKASMSRKGNCYDNSFVESFFHTLKVKHIHLEKLKTRVETIRAIFEFKEVWYTGRAFTLHLITKLEWSMRILI